MSAFSPEVIESVLYGHNDGDILGEFRNRHDAELNVFALRMSEAFQAWQSFGATIDSNVSAAHISALIYGALHSHVVSLKLFLLGLFVPSGNTQRYVLESIATAILASKASLGVLEAYSLGQYSTSKAIHQLHKCRDVLGLNSEATRQLLLASKLYDQHSHPTLLSLAALMTLDGQALRIFGGAYDEGKSEVYRKAIKSKVSLATVFPRFIDAAVTNYRGVA